MLAEAMAAVTADTVVDTLRPDISGVDTAADMRWHMLRADALALFAAGVANVLSGVRAETHALQDAHFASLAEAGEAAGEVVIGTRTPAITVGVGVIHFTELTVIPPVGIIIILTSTDTGLTGA
jgi:hypothetical protein